MIKQIIKESFGVELDISGDWGHTKGTALIVHNLKGKEEDFFPIFASMRANYELNLLKDEDEKYAGINPAVKNIDKVDGYQKITFTIQAIKKSIYNELINEYKQGYGKKDFDIGAHFKKRKEATEVFEQVCWFRVVFAKIEKLFFQDTQKGTIYSPTLTLDTNGVVEDKFYGKNIERSVLLTSIQSYQKAKEQGIDVNFGQLGENILLDKSPFDLKQGSRLSIGETELEITIPCTMCKSLTCIDKRLPKLLKEHRGIFAKVLKSGKIKDGDEVFLL